MLVIRTVFTGATGAPWLNTFRFLLDDTQLDADNASAAVTTFWTSVATRQRSSIVWNVDAEAAVVSDTGVQTGTFTLTLPGSGSGGQNDDLLPPQIQALIKWRTNTFVGGREIRGKTFVPGLTEGASGASGTLTGTTLTTLQTASQALEDDEDNPLVIWSRTNSSVATVASRTVNTVFAHLSTRRD